MDFKNWFSSIENGVISEISEKDIAATKNWYRDNKDHLPFNDIFGREKTRLIIPIGDKPEAESILDRIKSMHATIDFSIGMFYVFDERKNKNREVKLGKFILDKKSPFTEEEKNWWKSQGQPLDALKLAFSRSDYAIIVSRNPIDLIRMSDHEGFVRSCHNPSGQFFACAVAESKGNGAIAYVIKKSDLNRINLDDDEIFEDEDRKISGVVPISRVRLRKFVHKEEGYNLAVPEDRVYGKAFPGFLETVRSWALREQRPKIGTKRPSMKEFLLKGGSYRDTTAGELFNLFFGDKADKGDADYAGEDENQSMAEIWEEEIEELHVTYETRIRDEFHVDADVEINGGVPVIKASSRFKIPFSSDLLKKINEEALARTKYKILEAIDELTELPDVKHIRLRDNNGKLDLLVDFEIDPSNPDEYRYFLEKLAEFDEDDVKKIASQIYQILLNFLVIPSSKITDFVQSYEDDTFTHFDLSEDDAIWTLESKPRKLIVQSEEKFISKTEEQEFSNLLMQKLQNWADQILQMKKQQKKPFDPEYVNFHKRPFAQDFAIKPQFSFMLLDREKEQPPFRSEISLRIDFQEIDKNEDFLEVKEFVQFIDQNFEEFKKLVDSTWFAVNK